MKIKTNWDDYYKKPYRFSSFTRNITAKILIKSIYRMPLPSPKILIELGGANSCFYSSIRGEFQDLKYIMIDNNLTGLNLFIRSHLNDVHNFDLIECDLTKEFTIPNIYADIVFSVGLIEHFDPEETAKVIRNHFKVARKGALVIITFPTPTLQYRIARRVSEALGLWIFHDERPLLMSEVAKEFSKYGDITRSYINNKAIFTQGIIIGISR